jgi:hypothetical protein
MLLLLLSWLLSLPLLLVFATAGVFAPSSCLNNLSALSGLVLLLLLLLLLTVAVAAAAPAAAAGMSGALGHQYIACCSAAVCFDRNFIVRFWRSYSSSSSST